MRGRGVVLALALALPALPAAAAWPGAPTGADERAPTALYLVTLDGSGTTGLRGADRTPDPADDLLAEQDDVLATVGAGEPLYRWTTALNGFVVELDEVAAASLASDPRVALVEENAVVPLAGVARPTVQAAPGRAPARRSVAGAGTVIGFVDTGVDPDSRAFSASAPLGTASPRFRGECADAPDDDAWDAESCTPKVVGAQFFVDAYGADGVGTAEDLSPFDTDGHGTQVASIAAGTDGIAVRARGHRLGRFAGVASRARVAAYKACWSAPDPADDGCATADLVAAIDRATADRVDVLNLSVAGPSEIDTVERALLGATEAGIVVTAAAGNRSGDAYAAHPAPWVVTVGSTARAARTGEVVTGQGLRLQGAMASTGRVGRARLVLAEDAAADGVSIRDARHCAVGSLDAAVVADAVVVCRRGRGARVGKSRSVALAGGVGMVLVNPGRGSTDADLHAVPSVHLSRAGGRRLVRWARDRDRPVVELVSLGVQRTRVRVAGYSNGGDPTSTVLKPDVVAPGTEVLAAVPGGWELASGTSAAAAHVAGVAATLLARRGSDPAEVRSALLTTATPVTGAPGLRTGAGRVRIAPDPALAYVVRPASYRAWLEGDRAEVSAPQALLSDGRLTARRTITNVGTRPLVLSAHTEGFSGVVTVTPAAARLRPGQRVRFTISVASPPSRTDDGAVVWHSRDGTTVRIPVVVTR